MFYYVHYSSGTTIIRCSFWAPVLKWFNSGDFSSVVPAAQLQVKDSRFVLTPPGETETLSSSMKAVELHTICAHCWIPFPSGLGKQNKPKNSKTFSCAEEWDEYNDSVQMFFTNICHQHANSATLSPSIEHSIPTGTWLLHAAGFLSRIIFLAHKFAFQNDTVGSAVVFPLCFEEKKIFDWKK